MTSNEFYCRALLQIAGNSQFAIDYYNDEVSLTRWARNVENGAAVLTEIAEESKPFDDDEPDKPP
jgi:hypothetical protein